jgi:hypothetical protein
MQARVGPDGVVEAYGVELIEAQHTDLNAKAPARGGGDLGDAVGRIDPKAPRQHRPRIDAVAAAEFEDECARREPRQELGQLAAGRQWPGRKVRVRILGVVAQRRGVEGVRHGTPTIYRKNMFSL